MLLIVAAAHAIGGDPARDQGPDAVSSAPATDLDALGIPATDAAATDAAATDTPGARARFRTWRRGRPFVGGVLTAVGGVEMFFSGQLDIGKIHVQLGIEGLQATIIPILLLLLGILVIAMPAHRIFYGVIALTVAVYSLVGVNLGGFFVGMLLSTVGGILTVAWMPKKAQADADADADGDADAAADPPATRPDGTLA